MSKEAIGSANNLSDDVEDWLKGWGSLEKQEPLIESEVEDVSVESMSQGPEVESRVTEFVDVEPSYEGNIDLLGQIAERFETRSSEDYTNTDQQMIAEILRQAQVFAREDERKDADEAARALRLRVADAYNALMLADKYQFASNQVESAYATHRNAQRALDEYRSAYQKIHGEGVVELISTKETDNDHPEDNPEQESALTLPGDLL